MSEVLYDDGLVRLDDEAVTLRRYYFPTARAKTIRYDGIRDVETREMGWLSGRARGWGSTGLRTWLPLELGRHRKRVLVVLEVGARVRPAFSPDDPDAVLRLLRERI